MKVCGSEKGFTIIETMVALAILAIGILGVGGMLVASLSADKHAAQSRSADSISLQKIEDLKTQAASGLTSGSNADATCAYRWSVSNYKWLDTNQNSGMRQLDLTVGWPTGQAYPLCTSSTPEKCDRTLSVTTYFTPVTP
jgi:prepilin-type N-terminal cleavage/methylation domain-containing protein